MNKLASELANLKREASSLVDFRAAVKKDIEDALRKGYGQPRCSLRRDTDISKLELLAGIPSLQSLVAKTTRDDGHQRMHGRLLSAGQRRPSLGLLRRA